MLLIAKPSRLLRETTLEPGGTHLELQVPREHQYSAHVPIDLEEIRMDAVSVEFQLLSRGNSCMLVDCRGGTAKNEY